ncbi:hypothetical protein [Rubrivirga sp.]|uniref:hypothetical protein n=1 Tax=Rubrivirga sp. TaxID=1885344 RepID=UPI003B52A0D2
MITLTPSVFRPGDRATDFSWMIGHEPWAGTTLFVFNDNLTQSTAFLDQVEAGSVDPGSPACQRGGGNAAVRPYQCASPPAAAGVPTGPGFAGLADARAAVDRALAHVERLLATGRYSEVVYSADAGDPTLLGHSIFRVPGDVRRYVPARLRALVDEANAP